MSAPRTANLAWARRETLRSLPDAILVGAQILSRDATNAAIVGAPTMTLRERGALADLMAAAASSLYSEIVKIVGEDDNDPRFTGER